MDKIKIILSVFLIFLMSFLLSFFALQYAKQKGNDELFRFANPYDLVIKNARIIDGTGGEIFDAHVGVSNGVIKTVGKNLERGDANVFDATGYTLIPKMIEIPEETKWVNRDLPGAMSRFPYYRIFFKTSEDEHLAGRSLEAVLREGIYQEEDLKTKFTWTVLIAPEGENIESDNIPSAVYKISGWRSEALEIIDQGKIQSGYKMEGILYLTRNIDRNEFLNTLNNEIEPAGDFYISGNDIIDNTGKDLFLEIEESFEEETPEETEE